MLSINSYYGHAHQPVADVIECLHVHPALTQRVAEVDGMYTCIKLMAEVLYRMHCTQLVAEVLDVMHA